MILRSHHTSDELVQEQNSAAAAGGVGESNNLRRSGSRESDALQVAPERRVVDSELGDDAGSRPEYSRNVVEVGESAVEQPVPVRNAGGRPGGTQELADSRDYVIRRNTPSLVEDFSGNHGLEGRGEMVDEFHSNGYTNQRNIAPLNRMQHCQYSTAEISCLLPEYDGNEPINAWIRRFDLIQTAYQVSDIFMLIIMINKFKGKVKDWYFSRPDYAVLSYQNLKIKLHDMFSCRENRITLMRQFEARKWRKSESFADYFHDKMLTGNKLQLSDSDLIEYIIDGFDNTVLQSQARMKNFGSLPEMLSTMNSLTIADRGLLRTGEMRKPENQRNHFKPASRDRNSQSRCFRCGVAGHTAAMCEMNRTQIACYQCGSKDHLRRDCPQRQGRRDAAPKQAMMVADEVEPIKETPVMSIQHKTDMEKKPARSNANFMIPLQLVNDKYCVHLNALMDSGSACP